MGGYSAHYTQQTGSLELSDCLAVTGCLPRVVLPAKLHRNQSHRFSSRSGKIMVDKMYKNKARVKVSTL